MRTDSEQKIRFRVIPSEEGMLLRLWISRRVPEMDPESARALIRAGGVYINQLRVRVTSVRVTAGERITVYPKALNVSPLDPAQLRIVHRDAHIIVADKPPGVAVTSTKETSVGTLSDALVRMLKSEGLRRPYVGVVHRLDMRASGLVIFSVRGEANKSIHRDFKRHRIERIYRLELRGHMDAERRCAAPLLIRRNRSVVVADANDPKGVRAQTTFIPMEQRAHTSVVEARLETGRMHQIRVHAAHLGHPVVGDARYGDPDARPDAQGAMTGPLHLHAHTLRFQHPVSHEALELRSDPPVWAQPTIVDSPTT
jgi:RluA family pseudouridine synthase